MNAYEESLKAVDHRSELLKLKAIMLRALNSGDTVVERDYVTGKIDQVLSGSPIRLDPECQALFNRMMETQ